MEKTKWILCLICGNKTRDKIQEDTIRCASLSRSTVQRAIKELTEMG